MSEVVNGLLWSAGGLVVGFVAGYLVRGLTPSGSGDAPDTAHRAGPRGSWFDRVGRPILGLVIVALVAFTTWQGIVSARQLRDLAHCEHQSNEAFQAALAQRADASKQTNTAQRQLFAVITDPAATGQARLGAEHAYVQALDRLDATQAANPLVVADCAGGG